MQRHSQLGLDVYVALVLLLAGRQALDRLQQLGTGLVEMRIGDVDRCSVLARADVLQSIDRGLVLDVKTRGVVQTTVVRVVVQLVAIGRYSCVCVVDQHRRVR